MKRLTAGLALLMATSAAAITIAPGDIADAPSSHSDRTATSSSRGSSSLNTTRRRQWSAALAFDSDPRFLWAGTTGTVAKIDLATGARVAFGGVGPLYLAVNGEQRPPAAAFAPTIPALSPPLLFAVALGLIVLAWQRLRG